MIVQQAVQVRQYLTKDWQTTMRIRERIMNKIGLPVSLAAVRDALMALVDEQKAERKAVGHGFEWRSL